MQLSRLLNNGLQIQFSEVYYFDVFVNNLSRIRLQRKRDESGVFLNITVKRFQLRGFNVLFFQVLKRDRSKDAFGAFNFFIRGGFRVEMDRLKLCKILGERRFRDHRPAGCLWHWSQRPFIHMHLIDALAVVFTNILTKTVFIVINGHCLPRQSALPRNSIKPLRLQLDLILVLFKELGNGLELSRVRFELKHLSGIVVRKSMDSFVLLQPFVEVVR